MNVLSTQMTQLGIGNSSCNHWVWCLLYVNRMSPKMLTPNLTTHSCGTTHRNFHIHTKRCHNTAVTLSYTSSWKYKNDSSRANHFRSYKSTPVCPKQRHLFRTLFSVSYTQEKPPSPFYASPTRDW